MANKAISFNIASNGVGVWTYQDEIAKSISPKAHQPGMFQMVKQLDGHAYPTSVYIKEVIYSNPATIVFWSDNTKTICKCSEKDTYSKEVGLTMCIMKKLVGGSKMYNLFETWVPEGNKITLSEVRKKTGK